MSDDNNVTSLIEDLAVAQEFINIIRGASLDDAHSRLSEDALKRLRSPAPPPDLTDPDLVFSLKLFLATDNGSKKSYDSVREAVLERHPEHPVLTYYQVRQKIAEISGVTSIEDDMCINGCVGYTGPWQEAECCPKCSEPRYDPVKLAASGGKTKVPRQTFHTIPLGPQAQALRQTLVGAKEMEYGAECTEKIIEELMANGGKLSAWEDWFHGTEHIKAWLAGDITRNDIVVFLSIDGAQLYRNKQSDCWMWIWVVLSLSPDRRYIKKRVLPGGFIPGPNKPLVIESYLLRSLHHFSALQKEGLLMWDALSRAIITSHPYMALGAADGPGLSLLDGMVGHTGAFSCRVHCNVKGRRCPGSSRYYPAHLLPNNYSVPGCIHPDIDILRIPPVSADDYDKSVKLLLASRTRREYEERRRDTGISKPSIFSGLHPRHTTRVPRVFSLDNMHLPALNIPDLLMLLWRGLIECHQGDDRSTWDWAVFMEGGVWEAHGKDVANATPYLPGSFDRPPRNPVEKWNSGYKARECLMYFYGLGPGVFYGVLRQKHWIHFCKLVQVVRITHQRRIRRVELVRAQKLITEFINEYEGELYYQRRPERIHFCRPSLHNFGAHVIPEISRVGPGYVATQWTIERTIGNLGEEIRQPSNPYTNLSLRGVLRAQVNSLKSMIPALDQDGPKLPRGALDLGDGYVLLKAQDERPQHVSGAAADAIASYFEASGDPTSRTTFDITRWARVRVPNGQIARSAWKESQKPLKQVRMARNVKFMQQNRCYFGEVQYYFIGEIRGTDRALALVSVYSDPDPDLLATSSETLRACKYRGNDSLCVIDVKSISSVVAMPPLTNYHSSAGEYRMHYVVEDFGLEVGAMVPVGEEITEE
ncbi:hypothetical protein BOTBODRAFT_115068 [Botryobasidium botryosum FD-172 SS1]|uniref:Uncharacterized protein n=1 Tax=Botryobasidium botryosum (strain FD-172 SS1) TaxID=930990 RepID=A0A067M5A4_BOTB1|nr:hypothetical protein BOTBODRAFT_115068 [Botryobasidium botryosum FD-172 SS1]